LFNINAIISLIKLDSFKSHTSYFNENALTMPLTIFLFLLFFGTISGQSTKYGIILSYHEKFIIITSTISGNFSMILISLKVKIKQRSSMYKN
jgi:hypothetical protein